MANEIDILELINRTSKKPIGSNNIIDATSRFKPGVLNNTVSPEARALLLEGNVQTKPYATNIKPSSIPTNNDLDLLFNKTTPNISEQVGVNVNKAEKVKQVINAASKSKVPPKQLGAAGRLGILALLADAGIQGSRALDQIRQGNVASGLAGHGLMAAIDTAGLVPGMRANPYYWAAQTGTLPAHLIEAYRMNQINKKNNIDVIKNKDGGIKSDVPTEDVSTENINKTLPPTETRGYGYGGGGSTEDFINSLVAQNESIQPETSTINSTETLPQNEQSTSGVDLTALIGQSDAADKEYLNRLIQFAANFQKNAVDNDRRNLALAMIAKGTHNPYLMQAAKSDANTRAAKELELFKQINDMKMKPIERAKMAAAYAAAGLPPELAYLPEKALSPYANMYRTDVTRQNILDQIKNRMELAQYNAEQKAAIQQMLEQGRNARQQRQFNYQLSPDYISSRAFVNAASNLPDDELEKLVGKYLGGSGNVMPQQRPTTTQKINNTINKDLE